MVFSTRVVWLYSLPCSTSCVVVLSTLLHFMCGCTLYPAPLHVWSYIMCCSTSCVVLLSTSTSCVVLTPYLHFMCGPAPQLVVVNLQLWLTWHWVVTRKKTNRLDHGECTLVIRVESHLSTYLLSVLRPNTISDFPLCKALRQPCFSFSVVKLTSCSVWYIWSYGTKAVVLYRLIIYSKTLFILSSHWSSRRRTSSSSTISAASSDLNRDDSSDTLEEGLQSEDSSTCTSISRGAQPMPVITQGHLPLSSYRLLHNDLPSAVSTMVDESLFTSLCEFDWLIDWLIDGLMDGWIDWLIDWLIAKLVIWSKAQIDLPWLVNFWHVWRKDTISFPLCSCLSFSLLFFIFSFTLSHVLLFSFSRWKHL